MKHEEFRRICSDADTAVLFIHGINGTPNHFRDFVKLVPSECSVVNVLLDGHGAGVSDFANTSMAKWKTQVDREVEALLERHENLLIVGHSMGTLFAIRQAIKHPGKVKGLFLLAVPLKLFLKPRMLRSSMRVYLDRVREDDLWTQAAVNCYGIAPDRRFWKYIPWAKRYLELFREMRAVREQLGALTTPCYCYQSQMDELVSLKSSRLLQENSTAEVQILENSGHYYYAEKDYACLLDHFNSFVRNFKR